MVPPAAATVVQAVPVLHSAVGTHSTLLVPVPQSWFAQATVPEGQFHVKAEAEPLSHSGN